MTLEPKPPPREDQEPRLRYNGEFFPSGNRVKIITPPLRVAIERGMRPQKIGDDAGGGTEGAILSAPGELLIFDDGGFVLELTKGRYEVSVHEIEDDDPSRRRISGRVGNGSSAVLLVNCKAHNPFPWPGNKHWVLPAYCLIQNGQWSQEQGKPIFREFRESDPIEFDKVRFVMDGLSEFTGDAFSAVHKFSSFEDDPKTLVDLAEYAQHGFTNKQSKTNTWDKPAPLDLRLKTKEGDITFRIERLGQISEYPGKRGWETYCTMEFPKMLPLEEITKMMYGVKTFFDFLFQSSLALRKVWVYSSKQIIPGVNFQDRRIYTKEADDLSSVSVPVCWQLYFKWPETFREENQNNSISVVKIKFDDFAEDNKNLLEEYLGKFIDVVVHYSDKELGDFINFWVHCTYVRHQLLRVALSVHFPALEYFAQRRGMKTRRDVKRWMKCLMKPLGDDYLKFAEDFAEYRNKNAVHHDTREEFLWSFEDKKQGYEKLRVVMRFHFLNLLQPAHEELNKKLAKKIWETAWQ